jgi:hypothetical protein
MKTQLGMELPLKLHIVKPFLFAILHKNGKYRAPHVQHDESLKVTYALPPYRCIIVSYTAESIRMASMFHPDYLPFATSIVPTLPVAGVCLPSQ